MTAALVPILAPGTRPVVDDEPVALLQLCVTGHDWAVDDAASAVYREIRRGRRVVAVASGAPDAADKLVRTLEAIGVKAAIPGDGEALLADEVSVVAGPEHACPKPRQASERVLRIALAGRGVVGGGLLPRLLDDPRFELVGVLVRDLSRTRDVEIPSTLLLTDPAALLAREPDVLIEVTSDASLGLALTRAALARRINVVSASKQSIAADLPRLEALAGANGVRLTYSAAVGGSAPMIETVQRALAYGEITHIEGVLNGTCNYILEHMSAGASLEDALVAAQTSGFAEADPSQDLSGLDAAAKLAILSHVAGCVLPPPSIRRLKFNPLPGQSGLRQIAEFDCGSGWGDVSLKAAASDSIFSNLPSEHNVLRVKITDGRCFVARGKGAGRRPTCESIWSDLLEFL